MAQLKHILGVLLAFAFVSWLLFGLGTIIRFSFVSWLRTRGASKRLRTPEPEGVAAVCGFPPPPALVELYRTAPFIERGGFRLVDLATDPPARWHIYGFTPLTARDVREERKITGVKDGIVFASDGDKGAYVALPDGRVVLRSPNVPNREVLVAESPERFATFGTRRRKKQAAAEPRPGTPDGEEAP
ncbi:MAG: hypothetical protein U0229_17525 [Anaeromyxobacter sp.]